MDVKFDNTFNMFFGHADGKIDVFNNPYFDLNIYRFHNGVSKDENNKMRIEKHPDLTLGYCTKKQLDFFIAESAQSYYKRAVCFDKSKLRMLNNWSKNEFDNIFIAVDRC